MVRGPWPFSFAELLNKPAQLYLQPANPLVVRPGQLHITLGIDHRGVPQPLLQHRDRDAPQHAVAAVGVPEGVGVGPGRVYPTWTAASFITWPIRWRDRSSIGW